MLARIDPTFQQQTVREVEAGLSRSQAELEQAQREFDPRSSATVVGAGAGV